VLTPQAEGFRRDIPSSTKKPVPPLIAAQIDAFCAGISPATYAASKPDKRQQGTGWPRGREICNISHAWK